MFEKQKYYNQSKILENISIVIFIIYCAIFVTIGAILYEFHGLLFGLLIGFVTGYIPYLKAQIKVQEMRMMLEIHTNSNKN